MMENIVLLSLLLVGFFLSVFVLIDAMLAQSMERAVPTPVSFLKWEQTMANVLQRSKRLRLWTEQIDQLLQKSRLRFRGNPVPLSFFLVVLFIGDGMIIWYSLQLLNNAIAACLLGGISFFLPLKALQWDASYRKRQMIKQTPYFFLTVSNFYDVYGDAVRAIGACLPKLKPPLKREMAWIIEQMHYGVAMQEVFSFAKKRIDYALLRDFLDDLEIQTRYGGNFQDVMATYIDASIEQEAARMERESETMGTTYVIYFLFIVYLILLFMMIKTQPAAIQLLLTHPVGKWVVIIMILISAIVFYLVQVMTKITDD